MFGLDVKVKYLRLLHDAHVFRLEWVSSPDNPADALTKMSTREQFERHSFFMFNGSFPTSQSLTSCVEIISTLSLSLSLSLCLSLSLSVSLPQFLKTRKFGTESKGSDQTKNNIHIILNLTYTYSNVYIIKSFYDLFGYFKKSAKPSPGAIAALRDNQNTINEIYNLSNIIASNIMYFIICI